MFAALLLPAFRLQAVLRLREELGRRPVALVDETTGRGTVLELTPPALAAGASIGMASTQALARCPALQLLVRSLAQEEAVSSMLLEVACALSPEVEATREGLCTVDLRGAKISDWRSGGRRLLPAGAAPSSGQIGAGPNPDLASSRRARRRRRWWCKTPRRFSRSLAVTDMDPPPELLASCTNGAFTHAGQLTSLPKGESPIGWAPSGSALAARRGPLERLLRWPPGRGIFRGVRFRARD